MSRRGRKRRLGAEDKAVFEWERDRILPENLRDEMESMWEIPQIYHFLQLTKEAFNISHLSMYEVERMLLMPRASKQLAHIMTCLLSSPSTTKSKLQKVPPMPYEFWTNILTYKLRSWFKIYQTKRQDPVKVFDTLGVEPEFWTVFPDAAEIEGKDFQDFSFRQRVWLLKTVCDTAIHSRKTIQDEVAKQPSESQFETVLGVDRYGARYIYFPQFLHNDIRVYKHCLDNKILSTVKPPPVEVKPKVEIVIKEEPKPLPRVISRKKRRKSRWSNGSLPSKNKYKKKADPPPINQSIDDASSNSVDAHSTLSSRSSSKASEMSSSSSLVKSSDCETNVSSGLINDNVVDAEGEKKVDEGTKVASELMENLKAQIEDNSSSCIVEEDTAMVDDSEKSTNTVAADESLVKESSLLTVDDLSKSSKTDDEKLEVMSSLNASKSSEKSEDVTDATKDVNISKSDDEKLSEHKKCDTTVDGEPLNEDMSLDKWMLVKRKDVNANDSFSNSDNEASDSGLSASGTRRSARIKHISEIKLEVEDVENLLNVSESEELSSIDLRDSLCRVSSPEIELDCTHANFDESNWKVNNFSELMKDLSVSNFQLVADSLNSLRELIESIASDKTVPAYEPVKEVRENFVRPKCEDTLLKRLRVLCTTLENVEAILKESMKKARNKLQREWNNFENGVVDEDQDCNSEHGANRWLIGSQGWPQVHASLPPPTLPGTGTSEVTSGLSANSAEASTSKTDSVERLEESSGCRDEGEGKEKKDEDLACKEIKRELIENEAEGSFKSKDKGETQGKEGSRQNNQKEAEEPTQTKRVLRARGVSSYTEQLLSDESEEEEKLDGWADIEAIYAAPSSQANASSPNTPTKSRESCDESDEEDSDQDWILPSSRKRKGKRPSASRRLKSFQHKLHNINKADHDGKLLENQQQQPVVQGVQIKRSPTVVQIVPRQPPIRQPAQTISRPPPPLNNLPNNFVTVTSSASHVIQTSTVPSDTLKSELQDPNLHTVLDIKDEGPIYDTTSNATCVQPNYVVVTTGHAPVANYYVMQQNPPVTGVMQQNQFIQPTAFVSQMVPQPLQQMQTVSAEGYYVQQTPQQNYIVQNPSGLITAGPRQAFIATPNAQVVYQQQPQQQGVTTAPNYIQYVTTTPGQPQLQQQQPSPSLPRIINTMTLTTPRQINYRMRAPVAVQNNRMPLPARGQNFPHPNGAVIRSAPINTNVLRPGQRIGQPRNIAPRRQIAPRAPNQTNKAKPVVASTANTQKTTSLIVLSDSDDEIEMIIPANSNAAKPPTPAKRPAKSSSNNATSTTNDIQNKLPAELIQRIGEGNISISPIKPAQPAVTASSTQLIVVVNETGSHYALALPNGGKLILTPEQVAQIRASNGGKLVL
ncbi:hypothetical protein TSAR_015882 [Trichomalopsis sarcophagae]|uniref:Uncharacterized bromodomain-containing protein 10 helical domain-containing protein n=1 Tax=Trichomalopsis sarcophagae TaxID=543379 RepID=A0A232FIC9_9HYME|nr:hypothetical protein TSAR_015882 [Trichomalopsis sarcophagae]